MAPLGLNVCDFAWSGLSRPYSIIVFSFAYLHSPRVLATGFSFDPRAVRKEDRLCVRNCVGPINSPIKGGGHIFRHGDMTRGRPLVVQVSLRDEPAQYIFVDDEGHIVFGHVPPPPGGLSNMSLCGRDYYSGAVAYTSANGDCIGVVYP